MAANTLPRNLTPAAAEVMAAEFIAARRWHGEARMEAGTDDPADDAGDAANDDAGDDAGDDDKLGDAGQRALQAERDRRKAVADSYRPWRELARDLGLTPEQVRERLAGTGRGADTGKAGKAGDEPVDVDAIKREARAEVAREANSRLVRAEVKALAAETFADAGDAHLYLDLAAIDVDDDGEVDADEIKRQLAAVLAAKPHLAKPGRRGPKADKSQGARGAAKGADGYGQTRIAAAYAARENATTP